MGQVVIENPILNSPFAEPDRHFKFNEGITDQIVDGRRTSSYFVPIAKAKKKGAKQKVGTFDLLSLMLFGLAFLLGRPQ